MKNTGLHKEDIRKIVQVDHHDPFTVLGMHKVLVDDRMVIVVRAFLPDTASASVIREDTKNEYPMERIAPEGLYQVILPEYTEIFRYSLKKVYSDGNEETCADPYSFLPILTDFDIYLFNAGDHHRIYEKLGAHNRTIEGAAGVQFAVWAPNAKSVSVVGDFNGWDPRKHAMRVLGSSGVWEIFIPGLKEGELYKFKLKTQNGHLLDKTDPYATEMECRPRTGFSC